MVPTEFSIVTTKKGSKPAPLRAGHDDLVPVTVELQSGVNLLFFTGIDSFSSLSQIFPDFQLLGGPFLWSRVIVLTVEDPHSEP